MKKSIDKILANYFAGEASADEIEKVVRYRKQHPEDFALWEKAFHASVFENKTFDVAAAKQKMLQTINRDTHRTGTATLHYWLRVAALFAGLLLIGSAVYFYRQSQPVVYQNSTAQLMNIILPDGSEATLDKNATLQYTKTWWGHFQRSVNMSGRIYFHVTKDAVHPFRVYGNSVSVTVLGTRFTVNELDKHTQVFLTEGKVRVESNKTKTKFVITKPGEQVIVNPNGKLIHNRINQTLYASWKANKIHFNRCTVKEVVQLLDDSYGISVNITDTSQLKRQLYGSAPADDEQLIIKALSQILQTNIELN